jgi:hypothetical protein
MLEPLSPHLHYTILLALKSHDYNVMSIPLFLKRKSQHCWLNERLSFQNTLWKSYMCGARCPAPIQRFQAINQYKVFASWASLFYIILLRY